MSDKYIMKNALPIETLQAAAARLNVKLSSVQVEQICTYTQLLVEYNQHTNLVGNANPENLLKEHIIDSLTILPIIAQLNTKTNKAERTLIDIGSGAGFPGLILAIANEELKVTVVDATRKKTTFLESVVQSLDLDQRVQIITARAEELAHNKSLRASFDYATCRALGALPVVCELTLPFLKPGGYALLQRGSSQIEHEKALAAKVPNKFKASLVDTILLNREVLAKEHYLLVFKQEKQTPSKFPRSWQEIKASPFGSS